MIDYNIPDPSNRLYRLINNLYNDSGTELLFTKSAHDILFGFEDDLYTKIVELFAGLGVEIPPTFGLFATVFIFLSNKRILKIIIRTLYFDLNPNERLFIFISSYYKNIKQAKSDVFLFYKINFQDEINIA